MQCQSLRLSFACPVFEQALIKGGLDEPTRARVIEEVLEHGTCQDIDKVPEHVAHTFVVSQDIPAEEHVRMQAAMQAFLDHSLSKTCNFHEDATVEDVAQAYMLAWDLAHTGLTGHGTG